MKSMRKAAGLEQPCVKVFWNGLSLAGASLTPLLANNGRKCFRCLHGLYDVRSKVTRLVLSFYRVSDLQSSTYNLWPSGRRINLWTTYYFHLSGAGYTLAPYQRRKFSISYAAACDFSQMFSSCICPVLIYFQNFLEWLLAEIHDW